MTQRELGELAGTGPRVISDMENGKPTLRMDAANAILTVFGKMLLEAGVKQETLRAILFDNPRRFLAFVPKNSSKDSGRKAR